MSWENVLIEPFHRTRAQINDLIKKMTKLGHSVSALYSDQFDVKTKAGMEERTNVVHKEIDKCNMLYVFNNPAYALSGYIEDDIEYAQKQKKIILFDYEPHNEVICVVGNPSDVVMIHSTVKALENQGCIVLNPSMSQHYSLNEMKPIYHQMINMSDKLFIVNKSHDDYYDNLWDELDAYAQLKDKKVVYWKEN